MSYEDFNTKEEWTVANFTDILGALLKAGMSPSSGNRAGTALGGSQGGLGDLLGGLEQMLGAGQSKSNASGGLGDLLGNLGQMMGGGGPSGGGAGSGGLGGVLGGLLNSLGNDRSALGGLGALAGAILGGGKGSTMGAVGGGGLALLASLALSALRKAGQQPTQVPRALQETETPVQQQELENEAQILVRAMINAAKADNRIDEAEVKRVLGKLGEDGLTQEEQNAFIAEAKAPLDLPGVIASAGGDLQMAAQIYAASLLAIEIDTEAERQYVQQLAQGLGLPAEAVAHIQASMGLQAV